MQPLLRWSVAAVCALLPCGLLATPAVPAPPRADSAVTSVALAPSADCSSAANVNWSFTYSVNPAREFGTVTNLAGTVIGSFDQASTLSGGSFTGTWTSFISIPQPPNSLIGSYGGAGDQPPTANTAEYFVLYNCTSKQVLYTCGGNSGRCPRTAAAALALISDPIPVGSTPLLVATLLSLAGGGALQLRRANGVR